MKLFHFDEVQSTNDTAKQLLLSHKEVIVTADVQTLGRGRNGRAWHSGKAKDILLTYATSLSSDNSRQPLFYQACAALAVQAFLLELLPKEAQIALKYPNDVFVRFQHQEGKISGSLVEVEYLGNDIKSIIVGIGININSSSEELHVQSHTLSVCDVLHQQLMLSDITPLFIEYLTRFLHSPEHSIISEWIESLHIIGKNIRHLASNSLYTVKEVNHDGFLLCATDNEEIIVHTGDSIRYDLF